MQDQREGPGLSNPDKLDNRLQAESPTGTTPIQAPYRDGPPCLTWDFFLNEKVKIGG